MSPTVLEKNKFKTKQNYILWPKREIFIAGIFAQIRPVWVGDLGTRSKNPKNYVWGLRSPFISLEFFVLALWALFLKPNKTILIKI